MTFTITLDKFLIYSNPLTYMVLLAILIYMPFNWFFRKLQLHNLWFIFFQIKNKENDGLNRVIQASKRNFKLSTNRYYKYVFKLAIVKCRKQMLHNTSN